MACPARSVPVIGRGRDRRCRDSRAASRASRRVAGSVSVTALPVPRGLAPLQGDAAAAALAALAVLGVGLGLDDLAQALPAPGRHLGAVLNHQSAPPSSLLLLASARRSASL